MLPWGKMQSSKAIQCIHIYIQRLLDPKLLILSVNGVLCYFPQCVVLQGNARMFGINIDSTKVEIRARMEHFLSTTFEHFYIRIWSCMKLEDVLKVLPMLISFWISLCLVGAMNNAPRL